MPSSPVLSVIIPVYNDSDGVRQTLSSLVNQRVNPKFEIIVVDNNSTDETPQVIEEFERKHSEIVYGCDETDIQSSYAARNTGIENSSGEILAFIDSDVTVENNWVSNVVEYFGETEVEYLGCNVKMYIPEGEESVWAKYDASMGLPVEHYLETKQFVPTCALAVRREVVDQVGSFDESLTSGGDKEFGKRVHNADVRMDYSDQITVRHPARDTFRELVIKAKRVGAGQFQLWQQNKLSPHPLSPIKFLPPSPSRVVSRSAGSLSTTVIYPLEYFLKLIQSFTALKSYIKSLDW